MKLKYIAQAIALSFSPLFAAAPAPAAAATGGSAKRPSFAEKDWDDAFESADNEMLYIRFANGTVLEFDGNKVEDELTRHRLMMHGASQKIGDSFSGVKGNFAEGIASAQQVIDLLYAGEWAAEREGGGPRLAELAEAIARIKGVDVAKVREVVEAATPEERSNWRSNATVKHEVAKLREEKARAQLEAQGTKQELKINLPG